MLLAVNPTTEVVSSGVTESIAKYKHSNSAVSGERSSTSTILIEFRMASFALPLRSQAMAGGQITQKPRGFLDLPIEIRDRIYKELLCKFHIDERNDAVYAFEKTEDYVRISYNV